MSDSASGHDRAPPLPETANGPSWPVEPVRSGSSARRPLTTDQPTVISSRPPLQPLAAVSDSAYRILQGKIATGDRLGHFDLVEYIGGGGMGRVFRAYDGRLARHVALKILPLDQAADEETRLRFQNEAQSAARLDHENIARVFYVGEDHGLQYIVFEYIEGINIRDLVEREGPLPLAEAISYTLQVADALTHAAERAVVHRDIKPSNILITPDGHVKLIDMGLARLRQVDAGADLTASGVTLGTFDYISPEQARDPRHADVRSDIYSLGCTFFFMLSGRPPFPSGTVLQKLLQHQTDQPPDVRQFRADLPDDVVRVLRKMLAKDPRHRYQQPQAMVDELVVLAQRAGLHPAAPNSRIWVGAPRPRPALWRRHLPWLAPVAALAVLVWALSWLDGWPSQPAADAPPTVAERAAATRLPPPDETMPESFPPDETGEPARPIIVGELGVMGPETAGAGAERIAPPAGGNRNGPPSAPAALPGAARGAPEPSAAEVRPLTTAAGNAPVGLESLRRSPGIPVPPGIGRGAAAAVPAVEGLVSPAAAGQPAVPPAETPRKRGRLLVVNGPGDGVSRFPTLAAACAAAADGDVIELRFDGPREELRPIRLANVRLAIRAGEGFHPVVVFRPAEPDPLLYARGMLTLSGGRLTLLGVGLELHVPREIPAESWSLLECSEPQAVRLEGCWLTVRNASDQGGAFHAGAAVIRARGAPRGDLPGEPDDDDAASVRLELVDTAIRGEATVLAADALQSVQFSWQNGLLATSESLLVLAGGDRTPPPGAVAAVELRHLTALTGGGVARILETRLAPHALPLEVRATDCVFVGAAGRPLLEQTGLESAESLRRRVTWTGDHNFYEGFEVFWAVRAAGNGPAATLLDFTGWCNHWTPLRENLPTRAAVVRQPAPPAGQPLHAISAADLALSEGDDNPARGAASDGRDAGLQPERLPPPDGRGR